MPRRPFSSNVTSGERTVLVTRHGRTTANEEGIHQNWGPYPLSPTGIEQAESARYWWSNWVVGRIISSPALRACQTAESLWGRVDELDGAWLERSCPAAEGLTLEEANRLHPCIFQLDGWVDPLAPPSPYVESLDALTGRALTALRRAASTVPEGDVVAVVTHGALLSAIVTAAGMATAGSDKVGANSSRCPNLAVLQVAVDPVEGWHLREVHDPLA